MASVATGLAGTAGMNLLFSGQLMAQSILTPDEAIKQLLAGNERFDNDNLSSLKEDLKILRDNTVEKQEPFAAVLACADSRVPVEMIFDQTIGRIFVTRVAGNMVTPEIIASLEYGAAVLGTKVILVLGHSGCGAVKAALAGKEVPGQISALFPHLQPAIDKAGPNLEATTKANAQLQAALLRKSSPLLAPMVKEGKLKIIAGYYDVGSGKVTLIED
jgi:carbonic anhydrase